MAILNFKKQFVPMIRSGRKKHTIRATRKYPIKAGETLYLYTGLRQKGAKRIAVKTCTKVEAISIDYVCGVQQIYLGGQMLDATEKERLSFADGFSSFQEMMNFWDGRLPFTGNIIHWK